MDYAIATLWTDVGAFITDNTLVLTVITAFVVVGVAFRIGRGAKSIAR